MKRLLCGSLLLVASMALAQQQGIPPNNPPPTTPPTFPPEQRPVEPMPPDTRAPEPAPISNDEIQQQVQHKLEQEPLLQSLPLQATVSDNTIIVTGSVNDEQQRKMALRIAESYAGGRQVVDRIQVRG